jgi:predicted nucleotidyltransferase
MIDPLNIFQEIKEALLSDCNNITVYAFGSRVTGESFTKKWDFDVLVVHQEGKIEPGCMVLYLRDKFDGRRDENGNQIKIDVWTLPSEKFDEFINKSKNGVNVSLL